MINAEIHSDDVRVQAQFDATRWFEQASDKDIQGLIKCDFGANYAADAVGQFQRDIDPEVENVFTYIGSLPEGDDFKGFEVQIHAPDAEDWIEKNRPHLMPSDDEEEQPEDDDIEQRIASMDNSAKDTLLHELVVSIQTQNLGRGHRFIRDNGFKPFRKG